MKVYDDVDSLYLELEKEVERILNIEAEKIRKAMEDYIDNEIYKTYKPIVYERMDEFKKSATIRPAKLEANGEWVVEIYIPDNIVHSPSNWKGQQRTLAGIAEWFANGESFVRDEKLDVIEEVSKEYIDENKALTEIYNYLKSKFDIIM